MIGAILRHAPLLAATVIAASQAGVTDGDQANDMIRADEARHSDVANTVHVLADIYGPRLSGSPSAKSATDLAVSRLRDLGLSNARHEQWNFGHPGWRTVSADGAIIAPDRAPWRLAS